MKHSILVVGLLFHCLLHLVAQETPAPPDPARLSADWWSYLSPREPISPDQLETRAALLVDSLKRSQAEGDGEFEEKIRSIESGLDQYREVIGDPAPAPVNRSAPTGTINLDEAIDAFKKARQLEVEVRSAFEELAWKRSLIDQDRKNQSAARSRYLETPETATDRFDRGLSLMSSRINLETRTLENERKKEQAEMDQERHALLLVQLESIPARMKPDDSSRERWSKRKLEAEKFLADTASVDETATPSNGGIVAGSRVALLAELQRSLEVSLAQNSLFVSRIGLAWSEAAGLETDSAEWQLVQSVLDEFREWSSSQGDLRDRASESARRIRVAASDQMAEATGNDTTLSLLRDTLDAAELTDQLERRLEAELSVTLFVADLLGNQLNSGQGWLGSASTQTSEVVAESIRRVGKVLNFPIFEINETPVTLLGIVRVFFIVFVALWISRFVRRALQKFGGKQKRVSKTALFTVERMAHYVILAAGLIVALSSIGLDFTKFALFASALGVGLGFGLQNLVSNFMAGLIILFERSLNVGDFVELESGVAGEVREINMRSTLITTNDNVDILVPNSEFVGGRVTNWTLREVFRRIHIPFGVAYGTDKDLVRNVVLKASERVPWTLKGQDRRQPQVWFVGFGDSSLDFELVVWLAPEAVKRPAAVQADFLWEIESALSEASIEIPFPQRDLHLRSGFESLSNRKDPID